MGTSWKKTGEGKYELSIERALVGSIEIKLNSLDSKAEIVANDEKFVIKRIGFWESKIEILNKDILVGKVYAKNWYVNSFILEYCHTHYKLSIRNNPLAEWVIQENGKDKLSYGLDAKNGNSAIKISSDGSNTPLIFDFLLWYLFVPIATENMGDEFTFMLLIA
jgi:hypothetical protein